MQIKSNSKCYYGYWYDGDSYSSKIEDKKIVTANPLQRHVLENLPNTGKTRKKNTHLKKSKKRK